jgi:hypothetical protein
MVAEILRLVAADMVLRGFDVSTVALLRLIAPLSALIAVRTAFRRLSSFDASSYNAAMMFTMYILLVSNDVIFSCTMLVADSKTNQGLSSTGTPA